MFRRQNLRLDAGAVERGTMDGRSRIVSQFADVARLQAPRLTRHHRRRGLAARQHLHRLKLDLRAPCREMVKSDQRIGRIQADSDQIDEGDFMHGLHATRQSEKTHLTCGSGNVTRGYR